MIVYNLYVVIVILLAVMISCVRKKLFLTTNNSILIEGNLNIDMLCKLGFCLVSFGYLIFLASNRFDVGFDYFQYTVAYEEISKCNSLSETLKLHSQYELGYVIFEYVLSRFAPSYEAFLYLHALLVNGIFAIGIFMYSKNVYVSALLYLMLNVYAISLNFSRQIIAIAILFAGFGYLKKKKLFRYLLIVLLAMTFHMSAAIVLLFVAFSFVKPNKWYYGTLSLISFIFLVFSDKIIDKVCLLFKKYGVYIDTLYLETEGATNPFTTFFLLSVLVLILYFFTSWKSHSDQAQCYVKISFCCAILSVFMRKHYIMDRLNYYFIVWYILVLPDVIEFLLVRLKELVTRIVLRVKAQRFKDFFRYQSFYQMSLYVVALIVLIFSCSIYYDFSVDDGSHKAYPYKSFNENISNMLNASKSDEEILKSTDSIVEYLSLITDDDYIVVATYNSAWKMKFSLNDVVMDSIANLKLDDGLMSVLYDLNRKVDRFGCFILDSGVLKCEAKSDIASYNTDSLSINAYCDRAECWINVNGVYYPCQKEAFEIVVYSKSQGKVIDYCSFLQNMYHYYFNAYHNNLENCSEIKIDKDSNYKEILIAMLDTSNTVILYNNNEDFMGEVPKNAYKKYFNGLGLTFNIDVLCGQNVAAMRFGGEWREVIYPASPAQIEVEINGVSYDIYADSYKSYCKINGEEVSGAGTGLNILIISPDGEMLFNGSVNVYSPHYEVSINQ